jgi:hypothetical protein
LSLQTFNGSRPVESSEVHKTLMIHIPHNILSPENYDGSHPVKYHRFQKTNDAHCLPSVIFCSVEQKTLMNHIVMNNLEFTAE